MDYRELGKTGLKFSELGFGCGVNAGLMIKGEPNERVRAVARAMELGINYFDTAPAYGDGQSERNLGKVLKELRADVYVGTKVRPEAEQLRDIKGAVIRAVEESLKLLDRECIDLIQLHNHIAGRRAIAQSLFSVENVLGELVEAFQSLHTQGKARFYGITGLGETAAIHRVIGAQALHTVQSCYNLLNPSAGAEVPAGFYAQDFDKIIDRAGETGMGVIVISVLASGALSGVEERHPVAAPPAAPIATGRDYGENVAMGRRFNFLVEEGYVETLVEGAIRFALSKSEVSTVLVGYSSVDQLEKSAQYASKGPLPREVLERLPGVWKELVGG